MTTRLLTLVALAALAPACWDGPYPVDTGVSEFSPVAVGEWGFRLSNTQMSGSCGMDSGTVEEPPGEEQGYFGPDGGGGSSSGGAGGGGGGGMAGNEIRGSLRLMDGQRVAIDLEGMLLEGDRGPNNLFLTGHMQMGGAPEPYPGDDRPDGEWEDTDTDTDEAGAPPPTDPDGPYEGGGGGGEGGAGGGMIQLDLNIVDLETLDGMIEVVMPGGGGAPCTVEADVHGRFLGMGGGGGGSVPPDEPVMVGTEGCGDDEDCG